MQKLFFCLVATLIFGLSLPAWTSELPACPECPSTCVPEAYVDIQKAPLPENLPKCPSGCIPLGSVKLMLDEPLCKIAMDDTKPKETALSSEKSTTTTAEKKEKRNVESTRHRLHYTPTAVGLKKGEATITGYIAAAWNFEYGFHENLQAGVVTVLPISIIGIIPTVKFHGAVTDYLHLSIGGFGGCLLSYVGSGGSVFLGGGQGVASFVSGKHLINFSFSAMSAGISTEHGWEGADGALLVPSLGYRLEMHRNWSFQADLTPLLVVNTKKLESENFWLLNYGVRGHGDLFFGDLGFTMPLVKSFLDNVWRYVPLGIPYFSLGFHF